MTKVLIILFFAGAFSAFGMLRRSNAMADERVDIYPLLNLYEEGSDNLLFSSTNKKSDLITALVGGTSVALTDRERKLKLDYLTDGQLYAFHDSFDRAFKDHYVGFRDEEHLSDTSKLSITDYFIKGEPVFSQALIGPQGVSIQLAQGLLQQNYTTNAFDTLIHHDFGKTFYVNLDAHQYYFSGSGPNSISEVNQC